MLYWQNIDQKSADVQCTNLRRSNVAEQGLHGPKVNKGFFKLPKPEHLWVYKPSRQEYLNAMLSEPYFVFCQFETIRCSPR